MGLFEMGGRRSRAIYEEKGSSWRCGERKKNYHDIGTEIKFPLRGKEPFG